METPRIRSYLVLDLETTGFINARITEISLLGVVREHIEESHAKRISTRLSTNKPIVPRVVQKLNVCVYPNRMINNLVSEVTGLTNDLLQAYPPFDIGTCEQIMVFIRHLPKPVCMLAHNGYKFDFPIIKSQLAEHGVTLPEDLFCADTLLAFRALLYDTIKNTVDLDNDIDEENRILELLETEGVIEMEEEEEHQEFETQTQTEDSLSDYLKGVDDLVEAALCRDTKTLLSQTSYGDDVWGSQCWDEILDKASEKAEDEYLREVKGINLVAAKTSNEVTPDRKTRKSSASQVFKAVTTLKETKRNLFPGENNIPKPRKRYRLCDCYEYLIGREITDAHHAESDTMALLECMAASGPTLLEWIDNHCTLFKSVKKR